MLSVALTFDYEIFFGKNYGTYDEILFNPTNELLDLLDKYNVKATFFADVLSVYMCEKYGIVDYCEKFTSQIQDMVRRGHDVQLHIHSNWLRSTYSSGEWDFDISSYRIHSFGFDPSSEWNVNFIIKWGKRYLEDSLTKVMPEYRCIAYRAGGYGVQPHGELFKALLENGIFIDSSVALDQFSNSVNSYDFKGFKHNVGWWVNPDDALENSASGGERCVFELPIGRIKNSIIRRLLTPEKERTFSQKRLRGSYIGSLEKKPQRLSKIKLILNYIKGSKMLTCDSVRASLIRDRLLSLSKKQRKKNNFVSIIGHPKLIDDFWLKNFDNLLSLSKKDNRYVFTTLFEIGKCLKN